MKQRKVTVTNSGNYISSSSGYNTKEKASIRAKERLNRLAITKARKYLLIALACFVLVQIIKYLANNVFWSSSQTPSGVLFLFITYLQMGLLLFTFLFLVAAAYQALKRMLSDI